MNNEKYKEYIKEFLPKDKKMKKAFISFLVGGIVGVIGELLTELYINIFNMNYNDSINLMMITLIFFSCLFTAIGFFDTWVVKTGAGLFVPITGFAHSMAASSIEYKKEGMIFGIGSNIFKLSGSVILYGTVFAFIFAFIRYIFLGG